MSKRNVIESIDKLKGIVKDNEAKLMKQITSVAKNIKVPVVKEKQPGTSQFEKLMKISPEMAEFAGWDPESLHSRINLTQAVWNYVKKNQLQLENKKFSRVDDTLRNLLGIQEDTFSYPQLQKYIGQHLIK
jgi:chromatin remodeling complex protein RSC6